MKNILKILLSVIIFFGAVPINGAIVPNSCEVSCCQVAYAANDSDSEEIKKKKKKKSLKKEKGKKKKGKFFSKLFGSK
jgi:hypothetical protein